MNKKKIKDIAKVGSGQGAPQDPSCFSNEGIPFIRAGSLEKLLLGDNENSLEKIQNDIAKKYKLKLYQPGTVVFAKSGMSATKNRIYKLINACYLVNHLATLEPYNNIHPDFLVISLRRTPPSRLIKDPAYPSIDQPSIENFRIIVPEKFEDQIRIATLLSRAEALIAKRKESIRLLDELLKSTFLEMFGEKLKIKTTKYQFDELKAQGKGTFNNGPFGSDLLTTELTDAGVPVVYIRDIRNERFEWVSNVYVRAEKANSLPNCIVLPRDLLIAKVGDPPGSAAVYPNGLGRGIITQDVIRIRVDETIVLPEFLKYYLNSIIGKRLISKIIIKGTRSRFPLNELKKLHLQIPNLDLQKTFAQIVERVESLKTKGEASLQELENLYGSLTQRAFRGELDLSKIPMDLEEEKETEDETEEEIIDNDNIPFNMGTVKRLIRQSQLKDDFIFEDLQKTIADFNFEKQPDFDQMKEMLINLLEGQSPFLAQEFEPQKKQIVFKIKR